LINAVTGHPDFGVSDNPTRCGISYVVMNVDKRPKGLTTTAIFMSITNAMGWAIIDWSKPHARTIFVMFTVTIAIGYVVIWFYWKGKNWARILVLLTSLLCLYNLRQWNHGGIAERLMIGAEAMLAIFLLYWLNTQRVRLFFRSQGAADA
jgi:hypothetical protein